MVDLSMWEIKEHANDLAEEMLANKEEKIRANGVSTGFVAGVFVTLAIVGVILLVK